MLRALIRHATLGNLLMLGFLVIGIQALTSIKRESMPDFSSEVIQITAAYPGATAEEIEEAIAAPIEEALEGVNNIKKIETASMEGMVSVRVEMVQGGDWQTFYNEVQTEVEGISTFPDQMENLLIRPYNRTDHVFSVAIYGNMSPAHLKAYCERVKDELLDAAPGVMVNIGGFSQREFSIELRPEALFAYNLTVSDIAGIIAQQNAELPSGTIQTAEQDIKLRFSDRRRSVEDLANIRILASASGNELTLGDIASITDRFGQDEQQIIFNGQRAGVISVSKSKAADSLVVYKQAMQVLEREMAAAPSGVHFTVTRDMAKEINSRLTMLYLNAFEGFILVFLALWLFLNIKLSFWVAMGLPTSFLGGLFFMNWAGISLNMMSTFSLLIALGLLMDDAIVLAENVAAHLAMGESHVEAAVNGVVEVGRGVLSSFATTACIFLPLMFLSGTLGKILYVIPATLLIVLVVSLFEAFFILPGHLAHAFPNGLPQPGKARQKIDAFMDRVRYTYVGGLVKRLMAWRYSLLAAVAVVFAVSLCLFPAGRLKFVVFPNIDGDTVVAKVQMPPGTPLSESQRAADMLYRAAERMNSTLSPSQPDGKQLVQSISIYYSVNSDVADSSANVFTIYADLLGGDERRSTVAEVLQAWRDEADVIPGAMSVKFEDIFSAPGGNPIEIRLSHDNLERLQEISAVVQGALADYAGVFDITDDLTPGKPEIVLSLKPGALGLGLTSSDIARQLRAAYQGERADELQIGSENYQYNVRLDDNRESNLANFDNFLVNAGGVFLPLTAVADVDYRRSPAVIQRYNGKRTATVTADIDPTQANAIEITASVIRNLVPELMREYPGTRVSFGGQREAGSETGSSVAWAFLIGIIGIFILLSLQFESYLEPLIIMSTIPLAIIGAIWGHVLFGMDFNIQSLIGVVSIAGIVVNDSILMIEFIKMGEKKGIGSIAAAENAASDRFRALMLTSLTTIAGLLPILTERSLQAQMLIPLAISIVFGLITSTILVLFVTPAMYGAVVDIRGWRSQRTGR